MQLNIKQQRGEFNMALAGTIAALLIAIGAFLYANETSQHIAAQQAAIEKLQTTTASLQDQISQMTNELSELQTSANNQGSKLDSVENELRVMKEEAKKRAAKPIAKSTAKRSTTKPAAKTTTHKKK